MFRTLRSRLFRQFASLSVAAMTPVVAALAYQAYDRRAEALQSGEAAVFHSTKALITDVQSILHSAEETLRFVVNSPSVQRGDWETCQEFVSQLQRASERIAFVGVVNRAGDLTCPSILSPHNVTVADRLWFNNVRKTLAFSVGEFAIGRSSGRPTLHLSYPVIKDGRFAGAANIGLDVEWLADRLAQNKSPALPAVIYILDQGGRIVAKSGPGGPQIGTPIDVLPSSQEVSELQGRSFETTALDGMERLVRIEPLLEAPGGMLWSAVGVEKAALIAPAISSFMWALGLMGLAVALALTFFWLIMAKLVVLPIRALDRAAKSLKKGEAKAVAVNSFQNEVSELAATFNDMAIEVSARDKDRQELERKDALLREVSHRIKNHLASIASIIRLEGGSADPTMKQIFLTMNRRILAVADLYDLLAQHPSSEDVCLSEYINLLCSQLTEIFGHAGIELHTRYSGRADIEAERAMAVGFIVNEIMTNSVKHAFPAGAGRIDLELDSSQNDVELRITDNGVGLREDTDLSGIGMSIIDAMVRQLDGKLAVRSENGTSYTLSFPLKGVSASAAL